MATYPLDSLQSRTTFFEQGIIRNIHYWQDWLDNKINQIDDSQQFLYSLTPLHPYYKCGRYSLFLGRKDKAYYTNF